MIITTHFKEICFYDSGTMMSFTEFLQILSQLDRRKHIFRTSALEVECMKSYFYKRDIETLRKHMLHHNVNASRQPGSQIRIYLENQTKCYKKSIIGYRYYDKTKALNTVTRQHS